MIVVILVIVVVVIVVIVVVVIVVTVVNCETSASFACECFLSAAGVRYFVVAQQWQFLGNLSDISVILMNL